VPLSKINELQEALQLYERLTMKSEFLYTLRLYTALLVKVGDLIKLKELMMEYKFMTTIEEELQIDAQAKGVVSSVGGQQISINP
jgi:hypothetical protein